MAQFKWTSQAETEKIKKDAELVQMEEDALKKAIPAMLEVVRKMVKVDELTKEELTSIVNLYDEWQPDITYEKDKLLRYNGILHRVVQKHPSQSNWTPDANLALYSPVTPPDVIGEWVQPLGAHDAYALGAKVLFNKKVYESTIPANTYSPTAYPAGWKLVV